MDWNDVRVILEVVRTGSFTAAANLLGTSKPTVSRKIASFEQAAGVQLFRRGPQGAVLTEAGNALVLRALRVEEEILSFQDTLKRLGRNFERLVTIRMSEGVASYLIGPVLVGQELGPLGAAAQKEGIRLPSIKILTPDSPQKADIALSWTPVGRIPNAGPNDKVKKLADISFEPFYSHNYKSEHKLECFDDLLNHRLITMSSYKWFQDGGWHDWHILTSSANTVSTDWSSSVGHLTLTGMGIGLLPSYTPMYAEDMKPMPFPSPKMVASLWMLWNEEVDKDKTVRDCVTKLGKLFATANWMAPK